MALINLQTNLKSLSYGEFGGNVTQTTNPLVTADINKNPSKKGIELQGAKRVDDLKRITKLLTSTPAALKFAANNSMLSALESSLKDGANKTKVGTILAGAANTAKILASTLAQVPVSGTGLHFVKGFAGKQGYIKGVRGHIAYKNKSTNGLYNVNDGESYINLKGKLEETQNPIPSKRGRILNLYVDKFQQNLDDGSLPFNDPSNRNQPSENDDSEDIQERELRAQEDSTNPANTLSTRNKKEKGSAYTLSYKPVNSKGHNSKKFEQDNLGFSKYNAGTIDPQGGFEAIQDDVEDLVTGAYPISGSVQNEFKDVYVLDGATGAQPNGDFKDIIDFNFKVISPASVENGLPQVTYLPFRAYLTSFSDTFSSTWNEHQYIGRAESFYNYGGFGRDISFGFIAAASSRAELTPLYKKLNALAGSTAPSYVGNSFMRGNIVTTTVGEYLIDQPGFFTSIGFSWDTDYTWHTDNMNGQGDRSQSAQKDLPTLLNVELSFTPIHMNIPEMGQEFIGRANNIYVPYKNNDE